MIGAVWILIGLFWADGHANLNEVFGTEKPITYGAGAGSRSASAEPSRGLRRGRFHFPYVGHASIKV